ncbi:uncharacterized protein F5147DRAFT_771574 [Suillus discolor]|uniref:Uncharacterized protein n=1 Tax=Suillus discolor TaxID=1912936 RepID=A0A9P7JVR9_9AGAM|nr:uncharacterized protein F5147DRAFT_771574 [Suillus discolor]KAG2112001.1 hypothetical protein F5147DRAFT_771574 [Suillus discolor]
MPQDENTAQNLHAQILKEFLWYDDLISIMGGNPALSLKMVLSCLGMDHAGNYFSISSKVGSSYSETLRSGSAQFGAHPEPASSNLNAQLPSALPSPSGAQHYPPPLSAQPYPPPSGAQPHPPSSASQPYPPSGHHSGQPTGNQYFDCVPQYGKQTGVLPVHSRDASDSPLDNNNINMPDYFSPHYDDEAMDLSFSDSAKVETHCIEAPTSSINPFAPHHSPTNSI